MHFKMSEALGVRENKNLLTKKREERKSSTYAFMTHRSVCRIESEILPFSSVSICWQFRNNRL